jgi:hypothetical protein
MNMLMRAVFASAMLIGLAGFAQAETRIIYPPYSYEPPLKLCDYLMGYYCGYHHSYGHRYHHYDMAGTAAVAPGEGKTNATNVVVILPRTIDEGARHWNYRGYRGW